MQKLTISAQDKKGKTTSLTANIHNFTDLTYNDTVAEIVALKDAIADISESTSLQNYMTAGDGAKVPTGYDGNRGAKAVVFWYAADEGESGQFGSHEIGTIRESEFTLVGERLELQGAKYTALKTAFEAVVTTENLNTVEVLRVEFMNRNIN